MIHFLLIFECVVDVLDDGGKKIMHPISVAYPHTFGWRCCREYHVEVLQDYNSTVHFCYYDTRTHMHTRFSDTCAHPLWRCRIICPYPFSLR
jgi:hypothetical protein